MKAILNKLWGSNNRSTSVKAELREVKLNKFEQTTNTVAEIGQQVVQVGRDLVGTTDEVATRVMRLDDLLVELKQQKGDIDAYVGFEETYGFGLNVEELVGSYEGLEEIIQLASEKINDAHSLLIRVQNDLAE